MLSRREMLYGAGNAALMAQALAGRPVGRPAPLGSSRKIRIAIAGGNFGSTFFFSPAS
jgi:hypothetical protein